MMMDDAHTLVAQLHRRALLRLSDAAGSSFQGLAMAGKAVGVSSNWARRLRLWDGALGLTEKISRHSVNECLEKLDIEIDRCQQVRGTGGTNGMLGIASETEIDSATEPSPNPDRSQGTRTEGAPALGPATDAIDEYYTISTMENGSQTNVTAPHDAVVFVGQGWDDILVEVGIAALSAMCDNAQQDSHRLALLADDVQQPMAPDTSGLDISDVIDVDTSDLMALRDRDLVSFRDGVLAGVSLPDASRGPLIQLCGISVDDVFQATWQEVEQYVAQHRIIGDAAYFCDIVRHIWPTVGAATLQAWI